MRSGHDRQAGRAGWGAEESGLVEKWMDDEGPRSREEEEKEGRDMRMERGVEERPAVWEPRITFHWQPGLREPGLVPTPSPAPRPLETAPDRALQVTRPASRVPCQGWHRLRRNSLSAFQKEAGNYDRDFWNPRPRQIPIKVAGPQPPGILEWRGILRSRTEGSMLEF